MATFWNGYKLDSFLFDGFDITTPGGFAGVFVSLVSISICYEGVRTLRDFIYARFLTSKKGSLLLDQQSKSSSSPPSVRYSKSSGAGGKNSIDADDEGEREVLTGNEIGGSGDAFANNVHTQFSSTGVPNRFQSEEEDILMVGEDGSRVKRRLVGSPSPSPYKDATSPMTRDADSSKRRRELMDLSLSSLLHMIYLTVGYSLMLAVMTFNLLVLVAVIIGIGIGFCIFGPIRHNRELKLFKYFETVDSCQERLLPSHDQSKAESSSTESGSGGGGDGVEGSNTGRGTGGARGELVIGVQVHQSNSDRLLTSI